MARHGSSIGASGGKLQQLYNPANMKKRVATAQQGPVGSGGPMIAPEMPTFKKKLTPEKPKLLIARNAGKLLGQPKQRKLPALMGSQGAMS